MPIQQARGHFPGTVAAPGLYLGTDTTSGVFQIGNGNIGLSIAGTKLLDLSSGAVAVTGTLSVTGNTVIGAGATSNWKNLLLSDYATNASASATAQLILSSTSYYLGIGNKSSAWIFGEANGIAAGSLMSTTWLTVGATGTAVTGSLSTTTGIVFPATQNNQAGANTLDDYEEGTWTPVIANMTVVGAQTNSGRYTKIGNIVYFAAYVSAATSITWSASAIIDGLPYVGLAVPNGIASMRSNDSPANLQGSDYSGVQNLPDFGNSRFFVGNFTATGAGVRLDFSGFYFVAT